MESIIFLTSMSFMSYNIVQMLSSKNVKKTFNHYNFVLRYNRISFD